MVGAAGAPESPPCGLWWAAGRRRSGGGAMRACAGGAARLLPVPAEPAPFSSAWVRGSSGTHCCGVCACCVAEGLQGPLTLDVCEASKP